MDEVLPEQDQETWRQILREYVNLPSIVIPRFCLPSKSLSNSKIRLICLADAAEFAWGRQSMQGGKPALASGRAPS